MRTLVWLGGLTAAANAALAAINFYAGDNLMAGVMLFCFLWMAVVTRGAYRDYRREARLFRYTVDLTWLVRSAPPDSPPPAGPGARPWTVAAVLLAKQILHGGDPGAVWPLVDELLEHVSRPPEVDDGR